MLATELAGSCRSCRARLICSGVTLGRRPPIRPRSRAAASPAFVRWIRISRSMALIAHNTVTKNEPDGVDVSIVSVSDRKLTCFFLNSSIRVRRCGTDLPSRSSFHTTTVSPTHNKFRSLFRPGRSSFTPLIWSSMIS